MPNSTKQLALFEGYVILRNFFSERKLTFTFAIMLSPVRLSSACLSVTLMRPTQPVEIFRNVFMPIGHPLASTEIPGNNNKNSSGDEIANVNFCTTTTYIIHVEASAYAH